MFELCLNGAKEVFHDGREKVSDSQCAQRQRSRIAESSELQAD